MVEHGVILNLAVFLQQRLAGGIANASGIVRAEVERAQDIDGDLAIEAEAIETHGGYFDAGLVDGTNL